MKIFFLTRLFFPSIGGVQKHVLKISEIATKNGHNVSIITEKHSGSLEDFDFFKKIKIYRIPLKNSGERLKKIIIWGWLIKNKKLIKKADIIHAHDVGFWFLPLKIIFPKKKFYLTFHGYEPYSYKKIKNKIEKKFTERISQGSIAIGSYLKKWYGISPTKIIYGASSPSSLPKKNKKAPTFSINTINACFVGRLEKDTGIEEYIKTVIVLQEKYKIKVSLTICGNGSLFEKIQKSVKKNNLPIKLKGWVENPSEYILKSDIFFASQYLSIIEAAQLKKKIFSIYKDEIKKDYLLSLPIADSLSISNNFIQLAENIKDFISQPNKYEKTINLSYRWASRQTWENLYEQYLSLWKAIK